MAHALAEKMIRTWLVMMDLHGVEGRVMMQMYGFGLIETSIQQSEKTERVHAVLHAGCLVVLAGVRIYLIDE